MKTTNNFDSLKEEALNQSLVGRLYSLLVNIFAFAVIGFILGAMKGIFADAGKIFTETPSFLLGGAIIGIALYTRDYRVEELSQSGMTIQPLPDQDIKKYIDQQKKDLLCQIREHEECVKFSQRKIKECTGLLEELS